VSSSDRTISIGDLTVNRVGLGTNRLTDTEDNRSFLHAAIDAGLDFIDTAHLYTDGSSEGTIGAALSPPPAGVAGATKGGYRSNDPAVLRAEIDESLERLRVDAIDLWYLHRADPDVPIEETMGLVGDYVEAGAIRNVGLSEVSAGQIEAARAVLPIAAVQNEYGLGERKHDDVIDHCEAEGIAFVPFFPLAGGDDRAVGEIAARHEASPNQVKLAWLLQRSPCVAPIPGTLSVGHLRENLAALDLELSPEDISSLK
jgi:pyridoxine 4-dehydrogenase